MTITRGLSAAELLLDGRVLITGGQSGLIRNTAEIYNPATDSFTPAGSMATARYQHTMTRLADGSMLVVGGFNEITVSSYVLPLASMERYVPATNAFVPVGSTEARRARHNAVTLNNGSVFLVGGAGQSFMTSNSGEFYSPLGSPALTTIAPDGQVGVTYPATTLSASGGAGGPYQFQLVSGVCRRACSSPRRGRSREPRQRTASTSSASVSRTPRTRPPRFSRCRSASAPRSRSRVRLSSCPLR